MSDELEVAWLDGEPVICERRRCTSRVFRRRPAACPDPFDDYDDHRLECAVCGWPHAFAEDEVVIRVHNSSDCKETNK